MNTPSTRRLALETVVAWLALVLALAFPFAMRAIDAEFYISVASRIGIYAIAATSLNLLLGYGLSLIHI